jgi:hypothetical protein
MAKQRKQQNRNRWQLPFGLFAGPILWGLQIVIGYGLVTVSCSIGNKFPVYLILGIAALIVLVAGVIAYRAVTASTNKSILMEANQGHETQIFWSVSGVVISALFFLLILSTAITAIFLSPCAIITMVLP